MASKSRPDFCTRIQTYEELSAFAKAFSSGSLGLLVLLGPPGVGKSQALRRAVGQTTCWISGSATPFGIYCQTYHCRHRTIVLDDIDGLMRDRNGVRLLKALCQTDRRKRVSWQSRSAILERENIPQSFVTSSQVAIVANDWFNSVDVRALEDRGHLIDFDPPPLEVHRHASDWFWDQEVFDFVAEMLHLIHQHSLRTYVTALERKQAGLPWKTVILDRCVTGTAREVAQLKGNPAFKSEEDRVREFVSRGLGCRATYFNHAKCLAAAVEVPRIILQRSTSPVEEDTAELLALLKRRQMGMGHD